MILYFFLLASLLSCTKMETQYISSRNAGNQSPAKSILVKPQFVGNSSLALQGEPLVASQTVLLCDGEIKSNPVVIPTGESFLCSLAILELRRNYDVWKLLGLNGEALPDNPSPTVLEAAFAANDSVFDFEDQYFLTRIMQIRLAEGVSNRFTLDGAIVGSEHIVSFVASGAVSRFGTDDPFSYDIEVPVPGKTIIAGESLDGGDENLMATLLKRVLDSEYGGGNLAGAEIVPLNENDQLSLKIEPIDYTDVEYADANYTDEQRDAQKDRTYAVFTDPGAQVFGWCLLTSSLTTDELLALSMEDISAIIAGQHSQWSCQDKQGADQALAAGAPNALVGHTRSLLIYQRQMDATGTYMGIDTMVDALHLYMNFTAIAETTND